MLCPYPCQPHRLARISSETETDTHSDVCCYRARFLQGDSALRKADQPADCDLITLSGLDQTFMRPSLLCPNSCRQTLIKVYLHLLGQNLREWNTFSGHPGKPTGKSEKCVGEQWSQDCERRSQSCHWRLVQLGVQHIQPYGF